MLGLRSAVSEISKNTIFEHGGCFFLNAWSEISCVSMQECPHKITEIDIAGDQENTERDGTADNDLQLESEQRAMQVLYDYQSAARKASETARHRVPLPA